MSQGAGCISHLYKVRNCKKKKKTSAPLKNYNFLKYSTFYLGAEHSCEMKPFFYLNLQIYNSNTECLSTVDRDYTDIQHMFGLINQNIIYECCIILFKYMRLLVACTSQCRTNSSQYDIIIVI
uniref:Uncharacterized protein n=1 Tax=Micrurus spixii TaxID=129469 RepID=A0A2D4NG68_9SAUR